MRIELTDLELLNLIDLLDQQPHEHLQAVRLQLKGEAVARGLLR